MLSKSVYNLNIETQQTSADVVLFTVCPKKYEKLVQAFTVTEINLNRNKIVAINPKNKQYLNKFNYFFGQLVYVYILDIQVWQWHNMQ